MIALKLRRPGLGNEFLYPQIFAGLAYLVAGILCLELWRLRRRSTVVGHTSSHGASGGYTSVTLTARHNPQLVYPSD